MKSSIFLVQKNAEQRLEHNRLGLQNSAQLTKQANQMVRKNMEQLINQPIEHSEMSIPEHLKTIHEQLFGSIYTDSGQMRTEDTFSVSTTNPDIIEYHSLKDPFETSENYFDELEENDLPNQPPQNVMERAENDLIYYPSFIETKNQGSQKNIDSCIDVLELIHETQPFPYGNTETSLVFVSDIMKDLYPSCSTKPLLAINPSILEDQLIRSRIDHTMTYQKFPELYNAFSQSLFGKDYEQLPSVPSIPDYFRPTEEILSEQMQKGRNILENAPAPLNKLGIDNPSILNSIEQDLVKEQLNNLNTDFLADFRQSETHQPSKESAFRLLSEINRKLYDPLYENAGTSTPDPYPPVPSNPNTKEALLKFAEITAESQAAKISMQLTHETSDVTNQLPYDSYKFTPRFRFDQLKTAAFQLQDTLSSPSTDDHNPAHKIADQMLTSYDLIEQMVYNGPFEHGNLETALAYIDLISKEQNLCLKTDTIRTMDPPLLDQMVEQPYNAKDILYNAVQAMTEDSYNLSHEHMNAIINEYDEYGLPNENYDFEDSNISYPTPTYFEKESASSLKDPVFDDDSASLNVQEFKEYLETIDENDLAIFDDVDKPEQVSLYDYYHERLKNSAKTKFEELSPDELSPEEPEIQTSF